ncbi:MAG: hypothetical protein ACYC8T_07135 [Myxococcaceae bacterium]
MRTPLTLAIFDAARHVRFVAALLLVTSLVSGCQCGSELLLHDGKGQPQGAVPPATDAGRPPIVIPPSSDGGGPQTFFSEGPGGLPFDGGNGTNVKSTPAGGVALILQDQTDLHFMWIANGTDGTVSKFDTRTGKETGRYFTVIPVDGLGNLTGPVATLRGNGPNSPSRTAVDLKGDVWVGNRGFLTASNTTLGSVTKIANDLSSCSDRNGNGRIDTSRDLNGDGVIDAVTGELIVPTNWAAPAQYDECVLFSTPLGGPGNDVKIRALAISSGPEGGPGFVWAGHYQGLRFYKLDSGNGQVVGQVAMPFGPYGAAVDGEQRLWAVAAGEARLALIDTLTTRLVDGLIAPPGFPNTKLGAYGMTIDGKNRVWIAGWWSGAQAHRYDPDGPAPKWKTFTFSTSSSQKPGGPAYHWGRGIAADAQGTVWLSSGGDVDCGVSPCADRMNSAQLLAFNGDTGAIKKFTLPGGQQVDFIDASDAQTFESIGVGLDSDGHPWVANKSGNVMRVDRTSGALLRTVYQRPGLYTYSDFTGYQLRHFTAPPGRYWVDVPGCGPGTTWTTATWTSSSPASTAVQLSVRVAPSLAELATQPTPPYGPFTTSPADLVVGGVARGAYLRLEFTLSTNDPAVTPELQAFSVSWSCATTIN